MSGIKKNFAGVLWVKNLKSQSLKAFCDKYHPDAAVRISAMKYINQGWMENIPLYAVCNL